MRDAAPQTNYLKDYRQPAHWVESVELTFKLHPTRTRVISKIRFRPNEDAPGPFELDGEELTLISAKVDGQEVTPAITPQGLTCEVPSAPFTWEAEVEINPDANTALEGLYMSNGMYSTQCEAQGFRKITYYPDRPDVMAPFRVRIEGDKPILLSNGNPGESGAGFAEWDDPWPKPAYLFALVAGGLHATSGRFTTMEGRDVALNIWVRDGDQDKTDFALKALIASMKWDEEVYGRAYDLDVFNIVAVDDFNMGAMENKGLNIFNSSAVLASPETATDTNFERIEAIIAHEYFHNWTGNRITCRDWFQLCLKEGLTVFRDQQFSADLRSAAVCRIENVIGLRAAQFREDAGPLAHPVRPESFVEINNFYTATVYEKGAELIGMLRTLVGAEAYDKALTLYFERHDGDAATIEDWLKVFEDATGRDLSQFKLWYSQAGTPRVTVEEAQDGATYALHLRQRTTATPGQPQKRPVPIPVTLGLLNADGSEAIPSFTFELTEETGALTFTHDGETWAQSPLHLSKNTPAPRPGSGQMTARGGGNPAAPAKPVPSILRGFSAPVILDFKQSDADKATLLAHDTDPFVRWEVSRALSKEALIGLVNDGTAPKPAYLDGIAALLSDESLDPAYRALAIDLPSEDDMAQTIHQAGQTPDPDAIRAAKDALEVARAERLADIAPKLYAKMQVPGPYSPDAEPVGKRALANAMLAVISRLDGGAAARAQFEADANMTLTLAALSCLLKAGSGADELAAFYTRWKDERLVLNKWFSLQAVHAARDDAPEAVAALTAHPDFDMGNPNRFRALFGGFTSNAPAFHRADGAGYRLLAEWLLKLDAKNPQTAARMTTAFSTWRRYDADRRAHSEAALRTLAEAPALSRDTGEMVARLLG
ncbi:MAG: aminopeptidase N [Pseudomonadota bacterium]